MCRVVLLSMCPSTNHARGRIDGHGRQRAGRSYEHVHRGPEIDFFRNAHGVPHFVQRSSR